MNEEMKDTEMFCLNGSKRTEVFVALVYAETKFTGNSPVISPEIMKFIPKWKEKDIRMSLRIALSIQGHRRYIFNKGKGHGIFNEETRSVKIQCMNNHKLIKYLLDDYDKKDIKIAYKCGKHHIKRLYDGYDVIISQQEQKLFIQNNLFD